MYLAICTMQRNNAKNIREWVIYHSIVGVSKFYFLSHASEDNTEEVIFQLISEGYDIEYSELNDNAEGNWYSIQVNFYKNTYEKNYHKHRWISFIDGDEFLIPVKENNLPDVLKKYEDQSLEALGVYWVCYGSSGHLFNQEGLIVETYKHRMELNHKLYSNSLYRPNMHIKSIVKCNNTHLEVYGENMHIFKIDTKDELLRPFDIDPPYWFYDYPREPSCSEIRINHYYSNSLQHFIENRVKYNKKAFGDTNRYYETLWKDFDINDVYDNIMDKYIPLIKEKMLGISMKTTVTIKKNQFNKYSKAILNSYSYVENELNYLPDWLINMKAMSGKKYKNFINQLISQVKNAKYLEIGTWTGSTACSSLYKNEVDCYFVDNWNQFNPLGNVESLFFENVVKIKKESPEATYQFQEKDFRLIDYNNIGKYNIYFFDGPHEEQDQYDGIVYVQPALEDEFIFICDDWNWDHVRSGIKKAFVDLDLEILYSLEVRTTLDGSYPEICCEQSDWHNGYFIASCRKK
jgi:hypothetical protein